MKSLPSTMLQPAVREVVPGIFLIVTTAGARGFSYELEHCRPAFAVRLTIDFTGSVNSRLRDGGGGGINGDDGDLIAEAVAPPFTRTVVARLEPDDAALPCTVRHAYSWELIPSPAHEMAAETSEIAAALSSNNINGIGSDGVTLEAIVLRCRACGSLFVDSDFDLSLPELGAGLPVAWRRPGDYHPGGDIAAPFAAGGPEPGDFRAGPLTDVAVACALTALAERPAVLRNVFMDDTAFAKAKPAATAAAAMAAAKVGAYRLRLCAGGLWCDVIVDDRLPCYGGTVDGGPLAARCHSNELWAPLLEKAYAKAVGRSYAGLRSGMDAVGGRSSNEGGGGASSDGRGTSSGSGGGDGGGGDETGDGGVAKHMLDVLVDVTGAPFRLLDLGSLKGRADEANGNIWASVTAWCADGYIVFATTPQTAAFRASSMTSAASAEAEALTEKPQRQTWEGCLRDAFSYTVTAACAVGRHKLLRMRGPTPLGWTGDWADASNKWTAEGRAAAAAAARRAAIAAASTDGTSGGDGSKEESSAAEDAGADDIFWLSLEELCTHFSAVGVAMARRTQGGWHERRRRVRFYGSGKGSGNPVDGGENGGGNGYGHSHLRTTVQLYTLSVYESNVVFASLHQPDARARGAAPYDRAGVAILRSTAAISGGSAGMGGGSGNGGGSGALGPEATPAYEVLAAAVSFERQTQVIAALPPGQYVVVPLMLESGSGGGGGGGGPKGGAGEGFANDDWLVDYRRAPLASMGGDDLSPEVYAAIDGVFEALDTDADGVLSPAELEDFLRLSEGLLLKPDTLGWLLQNFGGDDGSVGGGGGTSGGSGGGDVVGLKPASFRRLYRYLWEGSGRDGGVLRRDLAYFGFDGALERRHSRPAVLAVHTAGAFDLLARPFDAVAYTVAAAASGEAVAGCV